MEFILHRCLIDGACQLLRSNYQLGVVGGGVGEQEEEEEEGGASSVHTFHVHPHPSSGCGAESSFVCV